MFSSRVPADLQPNRLARAIGRARAERRSIIDLTESNPTRVAIEYPKDLLAPLASSSALRYEPQPLGLPDARRAVAEEYARRRIDVDADRVVITASTSEAYSILFKLLCAPAGDTVLMPAPSYPLFDHLTRLDGVGAAQYFLEYHGSWVLAVESLDNVWSSSVRAVLAVSPNNPTGSRVSAMDMDAIVWRCAERGAALILDEVFADYDLVEDAERRAAPSAMAEPRECLRFRLGGLSKSAGLPQVKLAWIAVDGPSELVADALRRLELICDTYLSVSTPVQTATPWLIAGGTRVRDQILTRVRGNYDTLRNLTSGHQATEVLRADAGWSAVIRVPSTRTEEEWVLELLEGDGVLMHPGFFFDFPHEAFLVVSLLPEPQTFDEGIRRILSRVAG